MASDTIKKPDYEFWDTQRILNLAEWAYLLCDIEPLTETGEHTGKVQHILDTLYNDCQDRCIPCSTNDGGLVQFLQKPININGIVYGSVSGQFYIIREDLKKWLEHQKWKPKAIYIEERQKEKPIQYLIEGYEPTPLLKVMHEAIKKFCNADSIKHYPSAKTEEVENFIKGKAKEQNLPVSAILAKKMETIISPREYNHYWQKKKR